MQKKYIYLIFSAVILIWGVNWTVTKIILFSVPPFWTSAIRAIIATVTLLFLQIITKQFIIPKRHDLPAIFVVGIIQFSFYIILMSIGLQYVSVGRSVVLSYTTPLWVVPAAIFILKEPMDKIKLFGVGLGIIGIFILIDPLALIASDMNQIIGNILLLLAAFFWAISIIFVKCYTWKSTPFQLVFWQILLASIIFIIFAFSFEGVPNFTLTSELVNLFAYTGILAGAFGFWGIIFVSKNLPAVVMSLTSLLTPVTGIISSQIILGEVMDLPFIIGSLLIFIGIVIASVLSKTK